MMRAILITTVILLFAVFMSGCAGLDIMPQKTAMIPTGGGYEDCLQLETTNTLKMYFESSVPLKFNIHCHKDGKKVAHNEMATKSWEGEFTPEWGEYYCLQFQNDEATGAEVTYGFKVVDKNP